MADVEVTPSQVIAAGARRERCDKADRDADMERHLDSAGRMLDALTTAGFPVLTETDQRAVEQGIRPGDEVLIRGRVKQHIPAVGVRVELFSKTDQYEAWIREDLVEQVRPAAATLTHQGQAVPDVRAAIREMDKLIGCVAHAPAEPSATAAMVLDTLRDARNSLAAQLEEIGVPPYDGEPA